MTVKYKIKSIKSSPYTDNKSDEGTRVLALFYNEC